MSPTRLSPTTPVFGGQSSSDPVFSPKCTKADWSEEWDNNQQASYDLERLQAHAIRLKQEDPVLSPKCTKADWSEEWDNNQQARYELERLQAHAIRLEQELRDQHASQERLEHQVEFLQSALASCSEKLPDEFLWTTLIGQGAKGLLTDRMYCGEPQSSDCVSLIDVDVRQRSPNSSPTQEYSLQTPRLPETPRETPPLRSLGDLASANATLLDDDADSSISFSTPRAESLASPKIPIVTPKKLGKKSSVVKKLKFPQCSSNDKEAQTQSPDVSTEPAKVFVMAQQTPHVEYWQFVSPPKEFIFFDSYQPEAKRTKESAEADPEDLCSIM